MSQRLLILTASSWQLPVIRTAREMGLEIVATDGNPEAPGLKLVDHPEVIDVLDREGVLALARKHKIDGVVAEQTDVAVTTAAYVAEKLGLPGIGFETSLAATNKWQMRERCRAAGVPMPIYRRAVTLDETLAAADEIGLPVVLKPVDGQASRGVVKIWDRDEIPKWFDKTQGASCEGTILIEEMLTGTESSAECFVANGQINLLGICDKVKCPPPHSFDLRLIYPGNFRPEILEEIRAVNEQVIRAIGIPMGITHAEYIVTDKGVRLLEIAARGCGAGVATQLIRGMTGFDPIANRIRAALGQPVDMTRFETPKAGLLEFLMLPQGVVKSISGVAEAKQIPGVLDVGYHVKAGDRIGIADNGGARPGFLLATAPDRDGLLRIAEQVKQTLRVEVIA